MMKPAEMPVTRLERVVKYRKKSDIFQFSLVYMIRKSLFMSRDGFTSFLSPVLSYYKNGNKWNIICDYDHIRIYKRADKGDKRA